MTTNQRATVSEREKEGGRIVDQTNRSGRHHIARILSSSLGDGAAAAVHFHLSLTRHLIFGKCQAGRAREARLTSDDGWIGVGTTRLFCPSL
jgi:hypothetical protein